MKGVVFSELLDWIERDHGVEVLDEVLLAADLPHGGAYTSAGWYDAEELAAIVASLARWTGAGEATLLQAYGRHLFGVLARAYPDLVARHANALDLLTAIESVVHAEVRKLHPDADLPRFGIVRDGPRVVLEYSSPRPFADLARGLIDGCLAHFGECAEIAAEGTGSRCRFEIHQLAEAPCHATR